MEVVGRLNDTGKGGGGGGGMGSNLCVYYPNAVYMQKIKQQFMLLINVSTVIFKNNRTCQPTVFDIATIWHAAQVNYLKNMFAHLYCFKTRHLIQNSDHLHFTFKFSCLERFFTLQQSSYYIKTTIHHEYL